MQRIEVSRHAGWLLLAVAAPAPAVEFLVGPGMPYETPSEVAAVARDGDTVSIEAGTYTGDVAVWTQNDLTIRGVGGRPQLVADGQAAEGKAIWVVKGDNARIDNIEFVGARVADRNGAGIRLEGSNLRVTNSRFADNENGILTGADESSEVWIENCEFDGNGAGDGYSHNIYVGVVARLTVRFSYLHRARVGHQIKSRARENRIMYNRIADGAEGTSSYLIDLPNPGTALIVGNEIQQGPEAENWAMLHTVQPVRLVNNTFVNDRGSGVFIQWAEDTAAGSRLLNNLFAGRGDLNLASARSIASLATEKPGFVRSETLDFRLASSSPAVDAGQTGDSEFDGLLPVFEYAHPASGRARPRVGPIDIGAREYDWPARP